MPAFQLTSAWQKIASAGQTVEVENLSTAPAIIATASGGPPATTDGLVLFGEHPSEQLTLTADLYARCLSGFVTLEVMGGFSLGGSGASSSGGTTTAAAAALHPSIFAFGLLGAATS